MGDANDRRTAMARPTGSHVNRRQALSLLGATAGGGLILPGAVALAQASAAAPVLILPAANVCVLTPEVTEGPYYTDPKLVRADVTEGRPGVPTELQLQVVDAMCRPLSNARIDVWHCDATGLYSNYSGQGDAGTTSTVGATFMRGTLMTGSDGVATFKTVYPSWYRGRTTHIHFKVFLNTANVLTGQIFFPDALSEYLYRNVAPYTSRSGKRDTANNTDGIAKQATAASFAYVKERSDSYLAAMVIGINPPPSRRISRNRLGRCRAVARGDPLPAALADRPAAAVVVRAAARAARSFRRSSSPLFPAAGA
jgi:protocatechuate 3,4-dioxygenase beta subunit